MGGAGAHAPVAQSRGGSAARLTLPCPAGVADRARGAAQAARQYRRMLRRALLYTAAGTAGALAVYGLLRLARHYRAEREAAAAAGAGGGAGVGAPALVLADPRPPGLAGLAAPDTVVAGEQPLWRR